MTQTERFAEMDSMAEHSARFAPILSAVPDLRKPTTIVPRAVLARSTLPVFAPEMDKFLVDDMKSTLRTLFRRALKTGESIPTTFQLNVAGEHERFDRFEIQIVLKPIGEYLGEDVNRSAAYLEVLASEYAEAEASALVECGWAE